MSDLREQVARAIYEQSNIAPETYDDTTQNRRDYFGRSADAAIAVVIEELAQKAYGKALDVTHRFSDADTDWFEVPDWLRSQQERDHE